jgi:hypothetical protein
MVFPECLSVRHRSVFCFLCLVFLLLGWGSRTLAEPLPDIASLQQRALQLNLHQQRYWQVLLHYRKKGGGWESQIDDPEFFLAGNGKTNPRAELVATIAALFGVPTVGKENPRCRFVARRAWLEEELGHSSRLDSTECPDFERALRWVDPQAATLVFPGSYANSPASMFGHTLLNFNGPYQSKQLAHAANYSAFTDETYGFAYAIKGITGAYRGYYSLLPYYEKIKEYNGLERRDMWEYRLRLTPEETLKMFLHLWELRNIYSDYYFFDENCSYNLLFLLEAARPELVLSEKTSLWVLPLDTVRLLDRHELISEASYRPSLATLLARQAAGLDPRETFYARKLVEGELLGADLDEVGLGTPGTVRALEAAATAVELKFMRKNLDLDDYRRRYLDILKTRSSFGGGAAEPSLALTPLRPDHGHGPSRLGLGLGWTASRWVQELRFRPVNHGLLDPEEGYLPGSQIELGALALRFNEPRGRIRLKQLRLVDIVSLVPMNGFNVPVSWQVKMGLRRQALAEGQHLVAYLGTGGGYAWQGSRGLGYLLLETEGLFERHLKSDIAIGGGASAGYLGRISADWRLHLKVRQIGYLVGEREGSSSAELGLNLRLNRQNSLSFEVARRTDFGHWTTEGMLLWYRYW